MKNVMKTGLGFFLFLALVAILAVPGFARADEPKVRVSFGAGVTAGSISGAASIGGSVGYRFSPHFSFDVEVAGIDEAADRFSNRVFAIGDNINAGVGQIGNIMNTGRAGMFGSQQGIGQVLAGDLSVDHGGSTMLSTAGIRYLIPSKSDRFQPYLVGGLGVSRTEEDIRVTSGAVTTAPGRPGNIPPINIDQSVSHVGIVGSGGLGASLRVFKQLSLDIDARYYLMDRDRSLGTFGGGVSYRF